MALLRLRIYDNGGETIDRYTLILPDGEAWGFSVDPYHPQGFGQYAGSLGHLRTFSHLGKRVKSIVDLPERARKFVDEIATMSGDTYTLDRVTAKKPTAKRRRSTKRSPGAPAGLRGLR